MIFLKDCLTGKDNQTYDVARLLWAISVLAFIIFEAIHVCHKLEFDMIGYGEGLAATLASGAMSIKMKETTEPSKKDGQ